MNSNKHVFSGLFSLKTGCIFISFQMCNVYRLRDKTKIFICSIDKTVNGIEKLVGVDKCKTNAITLKEFFYGTWVALLILNFKNYL